MWLQLHKHVYINIQHIHLWNVHRHQCWNCVFVGIANKNKQPVKFDLPYLMYSFSSCLDDLNLWPLDLQTPVPPLSYLSPHPDDLNLCPLDLQTELPLPSFCRPHTAGGTHKAGANQQPHGNKTFFDERNDTLTSSVACVNTTLTFHHFAISVATKKGKGFVKALWK